MNRITARVAATATALLLSGCSIVGIQPDPAASVAPTVTASSWGWGDREFIQWPKRRPLRVMILGDSLSRSVYASTKARGYAPTFLRELRKEGRVRQKTAAISGAGAGKVASVADIPRRLDLAVIELGTNNVASTPRRQFRRDYRGLLRKVETASPRAGLVCLGTWWGPKAERVDRIIERLCTRAGGTYRPLVDLFTTPGLRGPAGRAAYGEGGVSDNFHPNDAGHNAIAARLRMALKIYR